MTRTTVGNIISLLTLATLVSMNMTSMTKAESLFRANASYQANTSYTPPSLFSQPVPHQVGDMLTILVNETSSLTSGAELSIKRTQTINQNGSNLFNSMVRFVLDKLPIGTGSLQKTLATPSFDGLDNKNDLSSKADSTRTTTITDTITCQVMQILPNGYLVVQGHKTMEINKERQDTIITGIVNPYYLDRSNQIASNLVGNFQILNGGQGVVSRQQNDGIANKIYQFFN